MPEAHSSVCGTGPNPGAGASSVGSLPGASHTRETNLARVAHPAPWTQHLRGAPEPGCSLAHPARARPSAPGCLHGGKGRGLKGCGESSQCHSLCAGRSAAPLPVHLGDGDVGPPSCQQPLDVRGRRMVVVSRRPGINVNSTTLQDLPQAERHTHSGGVPKPPWQQQRDEHSPKAWVRATVPWQGTGRTHANKQPNARSWGELRGLSAGSSTLRGPGVSLGIQPPPPHHGDHGVKHRHVPLGLCSLLLAKQVCGNTALPAHLHPGTPPEPGLCD